VGSNPTPSAKINRLGEYRHERAERTNREQNRSDSAHDSAQHFLELFRSLDGPPDPENDRAVLAGNKDGANSDQVKAIDETFNAESKAGLSVGQGKLTAVALEALPYFVIAYSALVMLWAVLGLIIGGRA
jgi:hypothetical protein